METSENGREIIITPLFTKQLRKHYEYITQESLQNAEKLLAEVNIAIQKIVAYPTSNPPVINFPNKTKYYRFRIVMKSFKIVYKVLKQKVLFVGIVHKRQGDKVYKAFY